MSDTLVPECLMRYRGSHWICLMNLFTKSKVDSQKLEVCTVQFARESREFFSFHLIKLNQSRLDALNIINFFNVSHLNNLSQI